MRKIAILIMASAVLLSLTSSVFAAEFLGYPIVPKQVQFYTIILGVIGLSMVMVLAVYVFMWIEDFRKKKLSVVKAALREGREVFTGRLAAQGAK